MVVSRWCTHTVAKNYSIDDHQSLGEMPMGVGRRGAGFGLGFGVVLNPGDVGEVSSAGEHNWGGAAGTRFLIDLKCS